MNDIKLTKEQFKIIWDDHFDTELFDYDYDSCLQQVIDRGWIVKDEIEEAIDELNKHYYSYKPECIADRLSSIEKRVLTEHHILANKVIEFLQKRIKELEGEK